MRLLYYGKTRRVAVATTSSLLVWWTVLSCLTQHSTARQVRYDDGRYSYSLSTFDSKGKLGQVERAIKAGNMGPPVVAIATDRNVFMVAPQVLPSPFIIQDGTTRFVQVTKEVLVSHTGLSADGRVLIAAAQILAIEHEYTFDEEIPVELLLQELSLLYQEYTMKPAARPFGCTLVVGFNPCKTSCYSASSSREPMIYRIDPSGTVTKSKTLVTNDVFERTDLPQVIERILKESNEESVQERLLKAVQQTIQQQIIKKKGTATTTKDDYDIIIDCILAASLSSDGIFSTKRHSPQTEAL